MSSGRRYYLTSIYFADAEEQAYFQELKKIRREDSLSGMLRYFILRGVKADLKDGLLYSQSSTRPDPDGDPVPPTPPPKPPRRSRST